MKLYLMRRSLLLLLGLLHFMTLFKAALTFSSTFTQRNFNNNDNTIYTNTSLWRRGVVVTALVVSTKLLYIKPGWYWDG